MCAAPGWDGKHSEWGEPSFRSLKSRQGDRVPLASTPVPDGVAFNIDDAARARPSQTAPRSIGDVERARATSGCTCLAPRVASAFVASVARGTSAHDLRWLLP